MKEKVFYEVDQVIGGGPEFVLLHVLTRIMFLFYLKDSLGKDLR